MILYDMKKVVTYSRVSTDHHEQNPMVQVEEMRRYCKDRGWLVVDEIVDHGFSGSSTTRPGLKKLMEMARNKEVESIMVLNLSRLFRSLKHLVVTLEEFHSLDVSFVSIKEAVDYSTPSGRLFVGVIGSLNEFTRELIRENTILGLKHARNSGKVLGRPKLRDDEMILKLRNEGLSYTQIQKRLGITRSSIYRALKAVSKTTKNTHEN